MNKWNDIVIVLRECQTGRVLEKDYQSKIEEQFKLLGWSVYYGCIESKPKLETANTNIFPDIVLRKDSVRVLPVELKRPTNKLKRKQELQLFSYMRQLELRVGLYIGEKVQLYYNAPDDTLKPHPIVSAELEPDSEKGQLLCDLLEYNDFDLSILEEFCMSELEKKRYKEKLQNALKDILSEDKGIAFVRKLIKEYFAKECVDETILKEEIDKIKLQIGYGSQKNKKEVKKHIPKKYPKYSLNGGKYVSKRELVLQALRLYVDKHPEATYSIIENFFNVNELPGGYKVVRKMSDIRIGNEAGSLMGRFYTAPAQILKSADGIEFAVSNQWDYNNFPVFVEIIRKLKWKVKEQ